MSDNITPFVASGTVSRSQSRIEEIDSTGNCVELFSGKNAGTSPRRGPNADTESDRGARQLRRIEEATRAAQTAELTAGQIWDALCNERVRVHYQPQYEVATGEVVAAEALLRIADVDDRLIYPDRFIKVAEKSDLIAALGRAVIEQTCEDLAACRRQGFALRQVAINLSAHQLNVDTQLPEFVLDVTRRHGLRPDDLEFELTERQEMEEASRAEAVLNTLAALGARIVIDDFGMGYSSVSYLLRDELSVSAIKLDRDLVKGLCEDARKQGLVRNLLSLAGELALDVVAEGVETAEQHEYLAAAGCPYAQGFGFARPMDIANLHCFMAERSAVRQGAAS